MFTILSILFANQAFSETKLLGTEKYWRAYSTKLDKTKMAASVGKSLAEKAVKIGIKNVSFDRSGYLYHGRVKSLADGAREGGLKF